ncbi:MAG: hypothetical protein JEY79_12230 [Pseudodesulfovibrio sp.]|nr:hypothetical protein [Pseudodesulfovibrio sp.]
MSILENAIIAAGAQIQVKGDEFMKEFTFEADFIGFDGHFPDNPILPAVVQLMAGTVATGEAVGEQLFANGVSRAKFLKQIRPGNLLLVKGTLTAKDEIITAAIKMSVDGEIASTFQIKLTRQGEQ